MAIAIGESVLLAATFMNISLTPALEELAHDAVAVGYKI
jgi:hypothetical protein